MDTVLIGPSEVRFRSDTGHYTDCHRIKMVGLICKAVELYRSVWSARDETKNVSQTHDEELAKDKIRPVVT